MNETVTIRGRLTDFQGNPLPGGEVGVKDADFNGLKTETDENGCYTLRVPKAPYVALYAVEGYAERHLEYWCWELSAYEDMELDMRIGGLELYAIDSPQPNAEPLAPSIPRAVPSEDASPPQNFRKNFAVPT